jgi:hypothetical protein
MAALFAGLAVLLTSFLKKPDQAPRSPQV